MNLRPMHEMVYYHGCTIPCHCLIVLEHGSHLHFDSDHNAVWTEFDQNDSDSSHRDFLYISRRILHHCIL